MLQNNRRANNLVGSKAGAAPAKKKQGPPPGWDLFMKERYEEGKRLVPNPNPETKDRYPKIQFRSALRDKGFLRRAVEEYKRWAEQNKDKIKGTKNWGKPTIKSTPKSRAFQTIPKGEVRQFVREWDLEDKAISTGQAELDSYGWETNQEIDADLRKGSIEDSKYQKNIKAMDRAFKSPKAKMPQDVLLSISTKDYAHLIDKFNDDNLEIGEEITDPTYPMASFREPKDRVRLQLRVPKGTTCIPTTSYDVSTVFFPRGTKMQVAEIDPETATIYLDIV